MDIAYRWQTSLEYAARIAIATNTNWKGLINTTAAKADTSVLLNENILSVCARYPDIKKHNAVSEFTPDLTTITFIEAMDAEIEWLANNSLFKPKSPGRTTL